jgi:hypothetical protein
MLRESHMKKPAKKKTHFVPKVVFRTAFVGVVPVCVAGVACGGKLLGAAEGDGGSSGMTTGSGSSGNSGGVGSGVGVSGDFSGTVSSGGFGVASGGFGVGAQGFSDSGWEGVALEGFGDANPFTVACIGFDGGPCFEESQDAAADAPAQPSDATTGDGSARDGTFAVACAGFCGADAADLRDGDKSG